ncbi:ArnT family glycosyltransferase [Terriglobus roseus]|uniref:Dolichyl-phosphate-mannose-protein mannosyltransferase n=1 Tax=Terriglobus roseus TaxID=392734 RepID=A0A1H4QEG5_9BACT|nr:glycosyltransferase family 39 protein [Terriglobus roseus]SEC18035.1 Dolichyl-phosphate-mannose-protein mannosyltransferase [Terriglobus roseus]
MNKLVPQATARQRPALSLPLLFAPVFLAIVALHATLLRLPYFWDEGGYYIPAAWDFFRLGTLIPETTMRNAHPPLPSVLLAAWWKIAGFHILSTRIFVCLVTTFALLAVFRLARMFAGDAAALAVMILTAIYPVWFAQSTLAHADIFAAAFTLWALTFYADRRGWTLEGQARSTSTNAIAMAVLFTLACLAKETAIVIPAALFCFEFMLLADRSPAVLRRIKAELPEFQSPDAVPEHHLAWRVLFALVTPAIFLALWYAYHHHKTGFTFGNPEFLRYNATANMSVQRIMLSLRHRLVHLTVHMNLYLPMLAMSAVFLLPSRYEEGRRFLPVPALRMIFVLLVAQWIAFSILGGALLTRYLLPAYPLLLIVCVAAWKSRVRLWPGIAVLALLGFAIGCEVNPPYPFAPEDNLSYRDMIVVHQHAIQALQANFPGATVLTAWPVLADLQRPELGYLQMPMRTTPIDNFSAAEIAKAASNAGSFDTALVFSTKYDPPPGGLNLAGTSRRDDKRFYDYHQDMLPGEVARALGGKVVWQEDRNGEWAAVLYFPRSYDVRLIAPGRLPR